MRVVEAGADACLPAGRPAAGRMRACAGPPPPPHLLLVHAMHRWRRYDGQVFVKPPEVLTRDRLLGTYEVKPVLARLRCGDGRWLWWRGQAASAVHSPSCEHPPLLCSGVPHCQLFCWLFAPCRTTLQAVGLGLLSTAAGLTLLLNTQLDSADGEALAGQQLCAALLPAAPRTTNCVLIALQALPSCK